MILPAIRNGRSGRALGLAAAILGLSLASLGRPQAADAQGPRYVDDTPGCLGKSPCHASIQAAVDAATEGQRILVAAGRYTETVLLVDKSLRFEGPGLDAMDRAENEARWVGQSGAGLGAALTVDARTVELRDLSVSGFRFSASGTGILLLGRWPGDPLGLPAGLPASTLPTLVRAARIADNAFEDIGGGGVGPAGPAAVVAYAAPGLQIVANRLREVDAGFLIFSAEGASIVGNLIEAAAGPGIRALLNQGDIELRENVILDADGRGIELEALRLPAAPARLGRIHLQANQIERAAAEGIRLSVGDGGRIADLDLESNLIDAAGRSAAALQGAVHLAATGGSVASLRISADRIKDSAGTAAGLHIEAITGSVDLDRIDIDGGAGPGLRLIDLRSLWLHRSRIGSQSESIRVIETDRSNPGRAYDLRIGGFPGEGNDLRGAGMGIVLENRMAVGASHDIDAIYNDWGVAYAPEIEARVRHLPDEGRLGVVSYLPALGFPAEIRLDAQPLTLIADGNGTSNITANLFDARGRAVADGALVLFGTSGGELLRPGAQAEAEDALAMSRAGSWTESDDSRYGLASRLRYLRSNQPGARLSWTVDADSVVLRYGQSLVDPGRFRVWIDAQAGPEFSALGPRREWVERGLVRDLSAGPHRVEIEVLAGELALDRMVAGVASRGGKASARLRAAAVPGRGKVTAEAFAAGGGLSASIEVPFVSGPPVTITLEVEPPSLQVGGAEAKVTAILRDAMGRPVRDGTDLRFAAEGGRVAPAIALTRDGMAETRFNSGNRAGPASVMAAIGGITVTRAVTLVAGPAASLVLTPTRTSLPANSVARIGIAGSLRDAWGNPVADGTPIALSSSLGQLAAEAFETLSGAFATSLQAGNQVGDALIHARSGTLESALRISILPTDVRLEKSVDPRTVVVPGESVTFTLRFENRGEGAIYDLDLVDRMPLGLISHTFSADFFPRGASLENRSGDQPFAFRVDRLATGQVGVITITSRVDTAFSWGTGSELINAASIGSSTAAERTPGDNISQVALRVSPGAAFTVTLDAPARMTVGGDRAAMSARVTDRFGNPAADDTPVFFTSDVPEMLKVEPAVAVTRDGFVSVTLISGQRAGNTALRALTLGDRGAFVRVRVAPGAASNLALVAAPEVVRIGGERAVLTATLRDRFGNGIPDALLRFSTDAGLLGAVEQRSDARGRASNEIRSGIRVGPAKVRVEHAGLTAERQLNFLPGAPASLMLELAAARVPLGGRTLAVARVEDSFGNAVPGVWVEFSSAIANPVPGRVLSDAAGRAETALLAGRAGSGSVTARAFDLRAERILRVEPARVYLPLIERR
jgi:uncharacterized repeat protein (TIGR01451 family)